MKKLLSIAVLAILGLTSVTAQDMRFGAKAGMNLATINGDETDDIDARLSFHVGGFIEFMISEKFSFQPEVIYSSQGGKSEFSETGEFGSTTFESKIESVFKADYLNIPLMAKLYLTDGLSLEAGPQIGFLISASSESETATTTTIGGDTASVSESESDDIKEFIKSVDFGANLGLAYRLENGLMFGARYNFGLSNINDFDDDDDDDIKQTNGVIQISLGYTF